MPHTYLVTLYLTDDQFTLLRDVVVREAARISREQGKPAATEKKRRAIDEAATDWQEIIKTMAENVW